MTKPHDTEKHQQKSELFAAACDLPKDEQLAFLERACSDPTVCAEVAELLGIDASAQTVLSDTRIEAPSSPFGKAGQLPESIGAYRVLGLIGAGGMGSVFEAEQTSPRRTVALKVLNAVVVSKEILRRFDHEAHVLGLLQHPGIAQIIEAGTFDHGRGNQPFFAMEFVDGQPLDEYIASHNPPQDDRLALFAEICDAVHHAHQRGVVHRDLKPANILVTASGAPKVLDFGVARLQAEEDPNTMLTREGQVLGTLGYMSPEQAKGDPDLDTSSDVYSLGVVLYEALCQELPYPVRGRTIHEAVRMVIETEPTQLGSVERQYRGDVETIVHKALRKEKSARYESAAAFAEDLRRYLRNEPITARRPTTIYQLQKFARRHRGIVAAIVLVMLSLAAGLIISLDALSKVRVAQRSEASAKEQAQLEAATAKAINEFLLQDMLKAASPFEGGRDVKVVDVLAATGPRVETAFAEQPLIGASIRLTMGKSYRELGLWKEAKEELEKAVLQRTEALGRLHTETQDARYELAGCHAALGDSDSAASEFDALLSEWSRDGTEGADPKVLRTMADKATMQANLGEFDAALALGNEAHDESRHHLGDTHDVTLQNQLKLAYIMLRAGRYADAESHFREFLSTHEKIKGESDPESLVTRMELSYVLFRQGRAADAEQELLSVIDRIETTFGRDNVKALNAQSRLAGLYDSQGKYEEATELHQRTREGYERTLGRTHPYTMVVRNDLAIHLRRRREYARAEEIARSVLADRLVVLGDAHESIAVSYDTIGAILQGKGDLNNAESMFTQACDAARSSWGPEHPRTIDILSNRANLLLRMERNAEAETALRNLVDISTKAYGRTHPYLATEMRRLGESLIGQDKLVEAEEVLRDTLALAKEIGPDSAREAHRTGVRLATALILLGRPADAEEPLLFSYRGFKAAGEERNLRELMVVETLVLMYERIGNGDEADRFRAELNGG